MSELKDKRIITPVGRLAFAKNLYKPNAKGRWTVAVVFDTDQNTLKALQPLKELVADLAKEAWPKGNPVGMKTPMKIENREDMLKNYPFMENRVTLNATNGFEIPVIDLNDQEVFEGDIKAGDQVRLSISGYTYDTDGNKGVGFNVNAVQFVRSDEAFYARQSASDMFASAPKIDVPETNNTQGNFDNFGF